MPYTFKQLPTGKVEILENGAPISSGTGFDPSYAKSLGYLPPLNQTATPSTGDQSPLLSFATSLDQAVNLAKQKRNDLSLGLMKPYQVTVAASDFSSILGNLNQASDTTASDLIKNATKANTITYKQDQIGSDLYQYGVDSTGKMIGKPTKVLSGFPVDTLETNSPVDNPSGLSGDILSTAGLSIAAFNYLTQGTPSMSRMPVTQRNQIMKEAQTWAKNKGIDISTFKSQYEAYNTVLQKNIQRANQTKIMSGEVAGSAEALVSAINEMDWNRVGNIKATNILKLLAGEQVNDPTTMKYSSQIQFMANDLAGYMAAARGATSPELQDQRDAANIISNGLSKKSVQAFKEAVTANEEKVAGVVDKAVNSTRKQVWGLFGVGDKYQSTQKETKTTPDGHTYTKESDGKWHLKE